VTGNLSSQTKISADGVLTVGADETAEYLTITATSIADSTAVGTAVAAVLVWNDFTLGDVNGDGKIDTTDARLVLQAIVNKYTLTDTQKMAADVNTDGKIDTVDARLILQYIVRKITEF